MEILENRQLQNTIGYIENPPEKVQWLKRRIPFPHPDPPSSYTIVYQPAVRQSIILYWNWTIYSPACHISHRIYTRKFHCLPGHRQFVLKPKSGSLLFLTTAHIP